MKGCWFAASNLIRCTMGITERWTRIANAILACMADATDVPDGCPGLADVLNGMTCGVVLHRPGQMAPLYYNTMVRHMVGHGHDAFGPEVLAGLLPRLTPSALSYMQLYGLNFGSGAGGLLRLQCGLLDAKGTERMYYGVCARLDAEDGASPVLTVFYDMDDVLDAATDDNALLDALTPDQSKAFSTLTQREKEVLALWAGQLGRQEIADHLFIDMQTVKTHCRNLKRKLGVQKTIGLTPFLAMAIKAMPHVGIPQRGRSS